MRRRFYFTTGILLLFCAFLCCGCTAPAEGSRGIQTVIYDTDLSDEAKIRIRQLPCLERIDFDGIQRNFPASFAEILPTIADCEDLLGEELVESSDLVIDISKGNYLFRALDEDSVMSIEITAAAMEWKGLPLSHSIYLDDYSYDRAVYPFTVQEEDISGREKEDYTTAHGYSADIYRGRKASRIMLYAGDALYTYRIETSDPDLVREFADSIQ